MQLSYLLNKQHTLWAESKTVGGTICTVHTACTFSIIGWKDLC